MKRYIIFIMALAFFIPAVRAEVRFSPELFDELAQSVNKVPEIKIPDYERFVLNNGLTVYLVEDHSLPIIEMAGFIKGGRAHERQDIAGISDFMTDLMKTGTANRTQQEMDRFKELHGLSFGMGVKRDYFTLNGNALIEDREYLLDLMSDVLMNPKFDADYYQRKLMELYQGLSMARSQDPVLVDMIFYRYIYGDHPYGYDSDIDLVTNAVQNYSPEKLMEYYRATIAPNMTVLVFSGDFSIKEMKKEIKKAFSQWEKAPLTLPHQKSLAPKDKYGKIYIIHKKTATQAKIKMGFDLFSRDYPEETSFRMANMVYGSGSFECRLMDTLRVEKGYAYDARAGYNANKLGGEYAVTTDVEPDKALETYQTVIREMNDILNRVKPITDEELFKTVNFFNALMPKFYVESIDVLESVVLNVEIWNESADRINEMIQKYNSIDAATAQREFEKNLDPEHFMTVILGDKDQIVPQFEEAGIPVEIIEM